MLTVTIIRQTFVDMKVCIFFVFLWSSVFATNNYLFEGNIISIEEQINGFTYKVHWKSDTVTARFSRIGELLSCIQENHAVFTPQMVDSSQNVYQMMDHLIKLGIPRNNVLQITYFNELIQLCSLSKKVRRFKRQSTSNNAMYIFPRTKWCGKGNAATSYEDLGEEREVDECCRTHDHCNNSVSKGATYLGYTNTSPFTVNSCECDENFKTCLQYVGTTASNIVGDLFFNRIGMICYRIRLWLCTDPLVRSKCEPGQKIYRRAYPIQLPPWVSSSNSYDDY